VLSIPSNHTSQELSCTTARVEEITAERHELQHWLRLITAKRDLMAARAVPPQTSLTTPESGPLEKADNDQLDVLLGLDGHVPSTSELAVLRRCVARVKERLADLDDKIIALEAENFTPNAAISRFSYTRATLS